MSRIRLDRNGRQLITYFLMSMVGIVAWNIVFFKTLREPPSPWATPIGDTIRFLLILVGGGLATLGCRRMSVEANFVMRPLEEGQPTQNGVYRLVRFPQQGGVLIALTAGAVQSLPLAILAYLTIVGWRWSVWVEGLYASTYSTYEAYRVSVPHRFIPYLW